MKEVNLLSGELRGVDRREKLKAFPRKVFAAVLGFLLLVFFWQLGHRLYLDHKIKRLEQGIARYEEAAALYDQLVKLEGANQEKARRLQQAMASELSWSEVLTLLPASTPPGVTHSGWRVAGGVFDLEGSASTYADLVRFIKNLEALSFVRDVHLRRVFAGGPQGRIEFSLQLSLSGGAEKK